MDTPVLIVASAARTATGNSGALGFDFSGSNLELLIDVTAVSGTSPSLTPSVEWSMDGGTTWAQADPADVMTAITAVGTKVKEFSAEAPVFRGVWALSGTPPRFTL